MIEKPDIKKYVQEVNEMQLLPADILTPSGELDDKVCDEPCDKFLQNLGCRCTGYKAEKLIFASDQQIPSETLTAGATASISQVVSSGQV